MDSRALMLPASIVLAGAFVGIGLYAGLRTQAEPAAPQVAPAPAVSVVPIAPLQAPPPLPGQPAAYGPLTPERRAELQRALEARSAQAVTQMQATWQRRCWAPSVAADPRPASLVVPIRLIFLANGHQDAFLVADVEPRSRQDVVECMRSSGLVVPLDGPLGDVMGVQLDVRFP